MFCYIKEWPNKMATLMTIDGIVLCTFANTDEAQKVWHEWNQQQKNQMQCSIDRAKLLAAETSETNLEVIPSSTTSFSGWLNQLIAACTAVKGKKVTH